MGSIYTESTALFTDIYFSICELETSFCSTDAYRNTCIIYLKLVKQSYTKLLSRSSPAPRPSCGDNHGPTNFSLLEKDPEFLRRNLKNSVYL